MRSRREYIITKDEVYDYANHWLKSLKLEYEGTLVHCQHFAANTADRCDTHGVNEYWSVSRWSRI